ncbi:MAG: hypothetical protein HZB15_11795, partial [Actinobacteria bacterium]|nr:hypothetical protein [Actinomycetota bacterium]
MRLRTLVALATSATVSLAACGGGGSDRLSEADFVDELADICADTNSQMDAIEAGGFDDFTDLADSADQAVDALTDTRDRLSELTPPEDLERDLEDFVDVVDDQIDAFGDFGTAARNEDDAALQAASDDLDQLT